MGLDVTHDCWHGAYGAFTRWRNALAVAAGYELYEHKDGLKFSMIDWGHVSEDNLFGEWDKTPDDPLLVLIAHSDCEGVIHPEQAIPLANRIEELMPLLSTEPDTGHIGDWKIKTQKFIDGLRLAAESGEDVEFH